MTLVHTSLRIIRLSVLASFLNAGNSRDHKPYWISNFSTDMASGEPDLKEVNAGVLFT